MSAQKRSARDRNASSGVLPLGMPSILSANTSDGAPERALRPKRLSEYVGQKVLRSQLDIYIKAATLRKEALDHVLLFGPPGLGKTTLALIIAAELGVQCRVTSGPVLEKPGDLAALLTQLGPRDVLFIDEIHRLSPVVEEVLYPAMEDLKLDILVGEGAEAKSIQVPLAPFTLVGATTKAGSLTSPLRDRFGIIGRMEYYDEDELEAIVNRSASLLGMTMEEGAAYEVACRARGTPRIANRLLRRVRDYADVQGAVPGVVQSADAKAALQMQGVDVGGLDYLDRRLLTMMHEHYNGGPVGLDTLSAALSEDSDTIESAVEPYLLQQGYIQRTPRGRMLTDKGRSHLAPT